VNYIIRWVAAFVAFAIATPFIYSEPHIYAALSLGLAVVVGIVFAPGKLGLLSWSAGIPAFYGLLFLVLPLFSDVFETVHPSAHVPGVLYIVTVGILAFAFGTNVMRFVRWPKASQIVDIRPQTALVAVLVAIGAAAMLWSYFFGYFGLLETERKESSGAAVVSALGFLTTIAHAMAWNAYFSHRKLFLLALLTTAAMLVAGLMANSKELILLPLALIALSAWAVRGRFPYKLAIAAIIFYALIVFPFVTVSRLANAGFERGGDRTQFAEAAWDYLLSGDWRNQELSAVHSLTRGVVPYFSEIVGQTGVSVRFMSGTTLTDGLGILTPRFINPAKPDMSIGNSVAREFGVISPLDDFTNLSPTYMGEFYMNFGIMGVVIGMFLVGIGAVLVDRWLIVSAMSWTLPIVVYLVRWQESFIGHSIVPFLKSAIVWVPILLLVHYIVRHRFVLIPRSGSLDARTS
jgi:hypothetical protein